MQFELLMHYNREMPESPCFIFATCQIGAEPALKQEIAREFPGMRFAFSRPGFLTFKIAQAKKIPADFASKLVFARTSGYCLGKASGGTPPERADLVWKLIGERPIAELHVWPRDRYSPGFRDYEPGMTAESAEIERVIRERAPAPLNKRLAIFNSQFSIFNLQSSEEAVKSASRKPDSSDPPCPPLRRGGDVSSQLAADVIIVDDQEWWVGYHPMRSIVSSWPGGFFEASIPAGAVSRAYLKMHEALVWSGFPIRAGQRCVEIGSAPGGASQLLMAQGLDLVGVDPAAMDPVVLADPRFRHIRKRSKEVPRREFIGVDWLTCDVNLPPNYTLDAVKAIVSHPGVRLKGLLLTLKLVDWSLAEEIPGFLKRIRAWGFQSIRARQLHHNRQEICVAASEFREAKKISDGVRKKKPARKTRSASNVPAENQV